MEEWTQLCWCRHVRADQWEVFLGLHEQSQTNEWTVRRSVKRIIAHHDYNPFTYSNDIALMELDANVTLGQNIWPICLPSPTYHFPVGCEAWITGWGATSEGGECKGQNHFSGCWSSTTNVWDSRTSSVIDVSRPLDIFISSLFRFQAFLCLCCRRLRFDSSTAQCVRL